MNIDVNNFEGLRKVFFKDFKGYGLSNNILTMYGDNKQINLYFDSKGINRMTIEKEDIIEITFKPFSIVHKKAIQGSLNSDIENPMLESRIDENLYSVVLSNHKYKKNNYRDTYYLKIEDKQIVVLDIIDLNLKNTVTEDGYYEEMLMPMYIPEYQRYLLEIKKILSDKVTYKELKILVSYLSKMDNLFLTKLKNKKRFDEANKIILLKKQTI
ncbi:MAG: hypothetical protein RSB71_02570 [Bacilli bacterium]